MLTFTSRPQTTNRVLENRSEGNRTLLCGSKVHRDNHYATLPSNLRHSAFRIHHSFRLAGARRIELPFADRQSAVVTIRPRPHYTRTEKQKARCRKRLDSGLEENRQKVLTQTLPTMLQFLCRNGDDPSDPNSSIRVDSWDVRTSTSSRNSVAGGPISRTVCRFVKK